MSKITVVIPNKEGQNPYKTLESLKHQTVQNFDIVIVYDTHGNANIARNEGFELVKTPYVLFSDNDIDWKPDALEKMLSTMEGTDASYAYGHYIMGNNIFCNKDFDADSLRQMNYISTMSLIKSDDFPGFDPKISRLQDWDLWLTMLADGKTGIYTGSQAFSTEKREGITFNSGLSWDKAVKIVKKKHDKGPFK